MHSLNKMPTESIYAFCLPWHLTESDAFHEIFLNPLRPFVKIEPVAWDGKSWDKRMDHDRPMIFLQWPPHPRLLESDARIIWVPMWDQVSRRLPMQWWRNLRKKIKIISFCNVITQRAKSLNLQVIETKYYPDPANFKDICSSRQRVLFYWNRTGMIDPLFLERLCAALKIERLIFRDRLDPGISESAHYNPPSMMGKTIIETVRGPLSRTEYLEFVSRSNLYIAPRVIEGVGLSFLEAMTQGSLVFMYDGATMNEYIRHKQTGYLFNTFHLSVSNFPHVVVQYAIPQIIRIMNKIYKKRNEFFYLITAHQNWKEIAGLDVVSIGRECRRECIEGFRKWELRIPQIAKFVLEW